MPIAYKCVGLTYSYIRGHAKYLLLARKLSSRFFCIYISTYFEMKKFLLLLFLISSIVLFANPVTNVRAIQEGKKIVVFYDLSEDTYVSQIIIEVDGKSRVIPNKFLKGDVDKDLIAGSNKRVEYDVLADYTDGLKSDNVAFEIAILKYEAIDLGLSVKWASCNVGASKPEEYGDYLTDKDISILRNELNENWKVPTNEDVNELMDSCIWVWTKLDGVYGYKVIGPNKNYIFLPAAGRRIVYNNDNIRLDGGKSGNYFFDWVKTDNYKYYIFFDINNISRAGSFVQSAISLRLIYI